MKEKEARGNAQGTLAEGKQETAAEATEHG